MRKKYFLFSLVLPMLFISLLTATPTPASAGWFEPHSLVASIGSFFNSVFSSVGSSVKSVFLTIKNVVTNRDTSADECFPPVSLKPNVQRNDVAVMTITPEISRASKDNIITISVVPSIDSLTVEVVDVSRRSIKSFAKEDIIDWGPKKAELPGGKGEGFIIGMEKNRFSWETYEYPFNNNLKNLRRPRLPAQKYWVTFRTQVQTTPPASDQNVGSYGWKELQYNIHYLAGDPLLPGAFKTSSGRDFYYVGGPQYPVGKIVRVGANPEPHYDKFVTVKAGEPFEIEAKPTGWQGGTMTIRGRNVSSGFSEISYFNARVIGSDSINVKSGESAIFNVLPTGTSPIEGTIEIKNNCNALFTRNLISAHVSSFKAPITYDFTEVKKENVRLTFHGAVAYVLDFKKPQSSLAITPALELMDEQSFVAPIPGFPLDIQAVYKDNPQEIVKNILITPEGNPERSGFAQAITSKEGTTHFKVRAPNITKEELSRGILLKTSVSRIPGLTSHVQLLFTGVAIDVTPKPLRKQETSKPEAKPELKQEEKQTPYQNFLSVPSVLLITPSRTLEGLKEGDAVTFKAILMMSDGSTRTTNTNVTWSVVGQIGSMTPNGIFNAQLDPVVAEYGEGTGAVVAVYKDASGKEFIAKSPIFKVKTFVPQDSNPQGIDTRG